MENNICDPIVLDEDLHYTTMPEHYPSAPHRLAVYQPAGYNISEGNITYLSIVLPLPPAISVQPNATFSYTTFQGKKVLQCLLKVEKHSKGHHEEHHRRLALLRYKVEQPEPGACECPIQIAISSNMEGDMPGDSVVGKVVMDSNMMPTMPV